MRLITALAGLLVVVGACAPVTIPPPATEEPPRCDAAGARSLIGSHVGAVDFAAGANVRIVCTTCATTRDFRADRLNVRFVEATGIIESVDCG